MGKTSLIDLLNTDLHELVSADSLQVYRGLDIGTAKPSGEILSRLPHHLIDIFEPTEQFDVGVFVRLANEAIRGIGSRGRIPVVSGGAGFYLKHLLYGLPEVPASTPEGRAAVARQLAEHGLEALYQRLRAVDPVSAERVSPADEYRITRALEVYETSGRPRSDFPPPAVPRSDLRVRLIGLERPRAELHARIAERVEEMFKAGLRGEVEALVEAGIGPDAPAMRGIGYQEFFRPDGSLRPKAEDEEIAANIRTHTRRYSKRQATFFRSLPEVRWFPADSADEVAREIAVFCARA